MKILLGDNQFFGINHSDLNKANKTLRLFSSKEKINDFIENCLDLGLDGFMINSNQIGYRVARDFNYIDHDNKECHYSIPYPHKYAAMVNESGMLSLVSFILKNIRINDFYNLLRFLLSKNIIFLLPILVKLEIPSTLPKGSVIYLQNVVSDLLMGLEGGPKIIEAYINTVEKFGYTAGIITLNPSHFRRKFKDTIGKRNLYLCFNMNKEGFNVFPSVNTVKEEIEYMKVDTAWKLMAMSIFSSGFRGVNIHENIEFIKTLNLDYVVFGSSKLDNIRSNVNLLKYENS